MARKEHAVVSDALSVDEQVVNIFVDAKLVDNKARRLEFLSKNLGQDIDLLLIFDPPEPVGQRFVNFFPVCWKVLSLTAQGTCSAVVKYTGQTALLVPQVSIGNLVAASTAQPCEIGQKCTLKTNEKQNNYLTDAVPGSSKKYIQCFNDTGHTADIGIGFYNEAGIKVEPALLWKHLANNATLLSELPPTMKIYAVSDYKEAEFVGGEIQTPVLWEQNLNDLNVSTEWKVSIEMGTGEIIITEYAG